MSQGEERTLDLRSPPATAELDHPVAIVVLHMGGGVTEGRRMAWVRRDERAATARSPARAPGPAPRPHARRAPQAQRRRPLIPMRTIRQCNGTVFRPCIRYLIAKRLVG